MIFSNSGASAVSAAISVVVFQTIFFLWISSEKKNQIKKLFKDLSSVECSMFFYITNKLNKNIDDIKEFFNREILFAEKSQNIMRTISDLL